MALGVDTTDYLLDINWADFYHWKSAYPEFAGRYFGGLYTYTSGEFKYANTSTHGKLSYIAPIQSAASGNGYYASGYYDVTGTTGYNAGAHDASLLCSSLANAVATTELHVPDSGSGEVLVWLDVESTPLKAAYWAGWANGIHTCTLSSNNTKPFIPGIYTGFYKSSSGEYVPNTAVQTALNNAGGNWPNANVRCRGLWSANPELCSYCAATADVSSDWSQFGTTYQTLPSDTVEVPLYLWQYAEYGNIGNKTGGCVYPTTKIGGVKYFGCGPDSSFAGGQNLDLDGSDSTGAETYMFQIVP